MVHRGLPIVWLALTVGLPGSLPAGVVITPSSLTGSEGAAPSNYTISLSTPPVAEVEVQLSTTPALSLNGCCAGALANLHFFPSNWSMAQTVAVAARDDLVTECQQTVHVSHFICSADPAYTNFSAPEVAVTVLDNDPLPPVSALPIVAQLPDPFLLNQGQRVSTAGEWRDRREELKGILQFYEYGFMAPAPLSWTNTLTSSQGWLSGHAYHYNLQLRVDASTALILPVHVYTPGGQGPFPVVLNIGDDAAKAALCMARDYMLVTYEEQALEPDTEGTNILGPAQAAYPQYDWGSLGVWAWGASRVMDYLQTRDDVDHHRIIIRGHSRAGKAALLAGAWDERFALTAPNGAGTAGPSLYRVRNSGSETLASITSSNRFAHWFKAGFGAFANKETRLPFDQHFLLALVAPRLLLTTDAVGDLWANPKGNQASREAALRVFDFLGAGANLGMHFRAGNHENLEEDWTALLDFADWHFLARPLTRNFDATPYPSYVPGYSWATPTYYVSRDLNRDGIISPADLQPLCNHWLLSGPSQSDLLEDSKVDFNDLAAFAAQFHRLRAYSFATNGDFEGWTLSHNLSNGVVSNGVLSCDISGEDPYLMHLAPLHLDACSYRALHVRLKNSTPGANAQLYWTTDADGLLDERKSLLFNIVPNDSIYRDYWIDLNYCPLWTGSIKILRLDPTVASSGRSSIEVLELLPGL